MITESISERVLFIGPEHRNHKGGVGAVIHSYTSFVPEMKFIPSYNGAYSGWKNNFLFLASLVRLLGKLITDRKIAIVHIHGASRGSFYRKYMIFLFSRILFRKKVVYHIHGGGFIDFFSDAGKRTQRRITRFINKADCIICLSSSWEQLYTAHFYPRRLDVVPNFVETAATVAERATEPLIFLFLGRIMAAKGAYEIVDVIEEIVRSGKKNIECWFGGNGEEEQLLALVKERKLEQYIKVLGWISGAQKQEALNKAHVYILPSYKEGMPVSILEAMAHGMPVISTYVGGIPELVQEDVSGFLLQPGDKQKMKEYIERFVDDPTLVATMGAVGKNIVRSHFSRAGVEQKLHKIYRDLLAKG